MTALDSPTPISEMDELDMPDPPEKSRVRKAGAAERSPKFNVIRKRPRNREEADTLGRIVRQPPVLEAFQKPLKPIGVRR